MKVKIVFSLLFTVLLCSACSKDNEDLGSIETEKSYLPNTIFLEYSTDQTVVYKLTYNTSNQIVEMVIDRKSGTDSAQIHVDFDYNGNGNLISAKTSINDAENILTFDYDTQNVITDMHYTLDGDEKEVNVLNGETPNSYVLDGAFGILPIQLEFDASHNLVAMGYGDNVYLLNYAEFGTGIFNHTDVQPALHIWSSFFLYLAPSEMYFFGKKELNGFTLGDGINLPTRSFYDNKLWDGRGNLIGFQLKHSIVPINGNNTILKCTITYESTDL